MNASIRHSRHHGFTLVETLVAILILAVGLFGMLGIVVNSVKLSSSSNFRSVAAQQAYSMAESLRANPLTLGTSTGTAVNFSQPGSTIDSTCLSSGGCGRDAFIGTEFGMWNEKVAASLPSGDGTVCRDSDPASHAPSASALPIAWNCDNAGSYVIKVCWNERRIDVSNANTVSAGTTTAGVSSGNGYLCTWTGV
jgi:type IV pilus assembly protein PilV